MTLTLLPHLNKFPQFISANEATAFKTEMEYNFYPAQRTVITQTLNTEELSTNGIKIFFYGIGRCILKRSFQTNTE